MRSVGRNGAVQFVKSEMRHVAQLHSQGDYLTLLRFKTADCGAITKSIERVTRSSLLKTLGLSPRELRMIDGSAPNRHPTITAKQSYIVVSLSSVARLSIGVDSVVLIMEPVTHQHRRLGDALHRALCPDHGSSGDPLSQYDSDAVDEHSRFEFRALEGVLKFIAASLDHERRLLSSAVHLTLDRLAQYDTAKQQEALLRLIPLKRSLSSFEVEVKEFKNVLEQLKDREDFQRFHLENVQLSSFLLIARVSLF